LKTVWDPARRVYKNVPTAVQPKKWKLIDSPTTVKNS
jgi:hypothetical protein